MHRVGLLHSDVKPDNILFTTPDSKNVHGTAQLADFGLINRVEYVRQTRSAYGTIHYMAPEMLFGLAVDERVDVWAAGLSLYYLATGYDLIPAPRQTPDDDGRDEVQQSLIALIGGSENLPRIDAADDAYAAYMRKWNMRNVMIQHIIRNPAVKMWTLKRIELAHLLCTILVWEKEERPSAEQVLQHPFFKVRSGVGAK